MCCSHFQLLLNLTRRSRWSIFPSLVTGRLDAVIPPVDQMRELEAVMTVLLTLQMKCEECAK